MNKYNALLYAIIEKDAKTIKFGTISYAFQVQDGKVIYPTLQITKSMRKKYAKTQGVRTNQNNR